MTSSANTQALDLAGIGIGPFNLSVAALLHKRKDFQHRFFDKKKQFNWHPNLMLDGARMQTSWMKDLVTPADPTSPFSFTNFLVQNGRFYAFLNAEFGAVHRQEFAQYLRWVAEQLPSLQFNAAVREVNFDNEHFHIQLDRETVNAKDLCIGTGTQPYTPEFAQAYLGENVFNAASLLAHDLDFSHKRVAVIGGGQTGAEVFLNALRGRWGHCHEINWYSRRDNFAPLDETPFTNDVFTPEYVNYFLSLSQKEKSQQVEKQKLASDGISPSTLVDIYQALYEQQFIEQDSRTIRLLPGRELVGMSSDDSGYNLRAEHLQQQQDEMLGADIVIFCTGFKTIVPPCLEPIANLIQWQNGTQLAMKDNYQIHWEYHRSNRIYAVNASRHHHGIVDPQTSLMAWRAATIINDIFERPLYPTQPKGMVQWQAVQEASQSFVA